MISAYQKACTECISLDQMEKYHGCQFHQRNSRLWSSGNPNTCLECYNWSVAYSKSMAAYRPNGDSPITPVELKLIQNWFMVSNTLWDFELNFVILMLLNVSSRR